MKIKACILNMPNRKDRRHHILTQFTDKEEYDVELVAPIQDSMPTRSLWLTLREIVKKEKEQDFFLFCEDDHTFTKYYDSTSFIKCIDKAMSLNADILSGGVSWVNKVVSADNNLFWIDKFSGLQFTIIFQKFFRKIIDAPFSPNETADKKISLLSNDKFVIYPYISIQKNFGYSDITLGNNCKDVELLFKKSEMLFHLYRKVEQIYKEEHGRR